MIDVVFDGCFNLIKKGGEFMGLLFSPVRNKFVAQGEKKSDEKWKNWLNSTPEIKKLIEEGKITSPPTQESDTKK